MAQHRGTHSLASVHIHPAIVRKRELHRRAAEKHARRVRVLRDIRDVAIIVTSSVGAFAIIEAIIGLFAR